MQRLYVFSILFFSIGIVSAQKHIPDIHDYVYVDQEAAPINYESILKRIGYPAKAMKAKIEGLMYVRILVSDAGAYVQHKITSPLHPCLNQAVEASIGMLEFNPAYRNDSAVFQWINLPIKFHLAAYGKRNIGLPDVGEKLSAHFQRLTKRGKYLFELGEEAFVLERFETAHAYFGQVLKLYPPQRRNKEKRRVMVQKALYYQAGAAMAIKKWSLAEASITELLGLRQEENIADVSVVKLHLMRGKSRIEQQAFLEGLRDFQWVMRQGRGLEAQAAMSYAGLSYAGLGAFEPALNLLSEAGAIAPEDSRCRLYLAEVLGLIGSEKAGREALAEVVKLGPPADELGRFQRVLSQYNVVSARD